MSYSVDYPLVSVIIPLYNCERFIVQAVESILKQSYENYEIIVIDDGSTDESRQRLEPYFDRIRYIYQYNQGVAAARNRGIELSKGELVAFLDHDDYWLSDKLAVQVNYLRENPKIGMVHSGWRRVNTAGETLGEVMPWQKAPTLNLEEWVRWKPVLLSAMLFQRDWLVKVGGLDTRFQQACDVDLVLQLSLMGCGAGWIHRVMTCYREHDRNDSLNTTVQANESWQVLDKFFQLPDVPDTIRQYEQEYRYYTLVWSAWRLYSTGFTSEMIKYLQRSLSYSSYCLTETILDWINCFQECSEEYDRNFNVEDLIASQEWKSLTSETLSI